MSDLSSMVLFGTGLATVAATTRLPALRRRIRRRRNHLALRTNQTPSPDRPPSAAAATPFALLKLP
jgi:hypothetical protein